MFFLRNNYVGVVHQPDRLVTPILFLGIFIIGIIWSIQGHAASIQVEAALISGDARDVVDADELLSAAIEEIDGVSEVLRSERFELFQLNADGSANAGSLTEISWDPTWDSALISPTDGENATLLTTNSVQSPELSISEKSIAVIGTSEASRYIAMGSHPFSNEYRRGSINGDMQALLENSLGWLSQRNDLKTADFNVVIAHMSQSFFFPYEVATRQWLDTHYSDTVSYNSAGVCDGPALASCLAEAPDVLIVSQVIATDEDAEVIRGAIDTAMQNGIPILYLHHDGGMTDLGRALFSLLNVQYASDNRNQRLVLDNWSPVDQFFSTPVDLIAVKTMLSHFLAADYDLDWSLCVGENCNGVTGLRTGFLDGAEKVRDILKGLDISKKDIFGESGFRLQKLLALIADRFRQDVVYPMDKVTTDDNEFLRSYYADYAQYQYRQLNPLQPNMGNFSRSDFSHITPVTRRVETTSKRFFRSTGAYALPGQTFTVTRADSSDVKVEVGVNTLRPTATHQWAEDGYTRPKFLRGQAVEIKSGETIEMTSSYGGPIQLYFGANDLPVDVTFGNIGEHAYWASTADDISFTEKLDAGEYDWAELSTPGFEVHSTLEKMRTSLNDPKWGSAEALAAATMRYLHNFPHALAGFKGPGIEPIAEVDAIAAANNWALDNLDIVKHMNADQATCGFGCSGNPYDAYWSYSPTAHGDVHELGHGLQGGQRFVGWENHSMTNQYSYYTNSKYHETTGDDPDCKSLPFEQQFGVLQQSVNAADPQQYMQDNYWSSAGWQQQSGMYIQMSMAAQYHGALENGWHLRALLHIVEREFNRADNSDSAWAAAKDSLGHGSFTRSEAMALDNNDRILIAASYATSYDFRDYLTMWGIPFSAEADAQVASFNFPIVERRYFLAAADGYCRTRQNGDFLGKASFPVDGIRAWPAAIDDDGDGYWNSVDNCPVINNESQADLDADGIGDSCDSLDDRDSDMDGVPNYEDIFPDDPNEWADNDSDGIGDNADPDDDNDDVVDELDLFPLDAEESGDNDADGLGDNADTDDDNDLVLDVDDNCPVNANPLQTDGDGDEIGDACDTDFVEEGICFPIIGKMGIAVICL